MDTAQIRESEERADARRRNRAQMPLTAALMDEWRRVFGPGLRLRWAREGEHEIGKPGPRGVPLSEPRQRKG